MRRALVARSPSRRVASRVNREWHRRELIAARKAAVRKTEARVKNVLAEDAPDTPREREANADHDYLLLGLLPTFSNPSRTALLLYRLTNARPSFTASSSNSTSSEISRMPDAIISLEN